MRVLETVTSGPDTGLPISVAEVKAVLGITGSAQDQQIQNAIRAAQGAVEGYLNYPLGRATVSAEYRFDPGDRGSITDYLIFERWPLISVTSVTFDTDTDALPSAQYQADYQRALLYRLDPSGFNSTWYWFQKNVVVYTAGYTMPLDRSDPAQAAIAGGLQIMTIGLYYVGRRDPSIKAVDIPEVIRTEYWVGPITGSSVLPPGVSPDVAVMLDPYRRFT